MGASGRRCRAAVGAGAEVAARHLTCSPHCSWCPPRWVMPAREHGQVLLGAGASELCRGSGRGAHLLGVRHSLGAWLLGHNVPQVLVVVTGARLLAEIPGAPAGVGPAQALGAALPRCQLQWGAQLSAAVPSHDRGVRGCGGVGPCQRFASGQMQSWDRQQVHALESVRQTALPGAACHGGSVWHQCLAL